MSMNKKGEQMVEAAMVLPILILILLSLVLLMAHEYQCHWNQIDMHRNLLSTWDKSTSAFDIKTKTTETSSEVDGAVAMEFQKEIESRIYVFSETKCIRLGEMLDFDEE